MFIRVKSTPNSPRKAVQIVEGKRFGKGVRQSIIAHIGVALNAEEEVKLKALATEKIKQIIKAESAKSNLKLTDQDIQDLMKRGRKKKQHLASTSDNRDASAVVLDNMIEEFRLNDGVGDIVGKIFEEFGFGQLLKSSKQSQLLKDVVLSRMIYPQSKLALCETMYEKFNKHYNVDQVYRMMDNLYPSIDNIKRLVFNKTHALMPKVNVVLFDVTTLYCESVNQDSLREFGFSKDGKFNNTQLVLALATNELGLPIGYEIFPGNYAEVKTLLAAINKWSGMFDIKSACFIGDRAMFSDDNINLIESHGYEYIIAAKLRGAPRELQQQILDEHNYSKVKFGEEDGLVAEFVYPQKVDHVRCTLGNDIQGYIVTIDGAVITSIKYVSPLNVTSVANKEAFNKHITQLNKLRRYSSRCRCALLEPSEYELVKDDFINNVAVIVGTDIIYNGHKASITKLSEKQQINLLESAAKGRISNKIMLELFDDHYKYKTYINIPCEIMVELFHEYKIPSRRLCVSYKESRAVNDAKKRERIIERLKSQEGSTNKVLKTTAKMYMNATGDAAINDIKIAEAEKWDGIHGVITNIASDTIQNILSRYSNLWRIEEAFRINKHNLQMRPVYHYKAERIHAHIAICYMSFAALKLMQYQTQVTQPRFTIDNILSTLLSVESSIYMDSTTNLRYRMPGHLSANAKMLYRAFGIKRNSKMSLYPH